MDDSPLSNGPSEMNKVYLKRRFSLLVSLILVLVLLAFFVILTSPQPQKPASELDSGPEITPPPIYEQPVPELEPEVEEVEEPTVEACTMAPIEELGCLELNEGANIFGAYGLNFDDRSVRSLIREVERECDTDDADGFVDRDCIVDTTVYKSENSWVCEWDCLKDMASCETYKMHLAVAILRRYIPPTDVFVVRTENFDFFLLYRDNQGDWIQKFYFGSHKPVFEALYNDVYHAGPMTEVVFPEILEVEAGDKFCFDVYANRSCVCSVEVATFTVGDCPQLPADLRGVCEAPVTEVYLNRGKNEICFEVDEDAEEEFYTYNFELTSGEDFIPAGNAFIKEKKWDCCVNASFKGFLSIED